MNVERDRLEQDGAAWKPWGPYLSERAWGTVREDFSANGVVDAEFAKQQFVLLGREWYQHPNGQIPAYEWAFGDVNPPVCAWTAWRVYEIDRKQRGRGDTAFLERVFHKLMLNFTGWVNRKDVEDNNMFDGEGEFFYDAVGVAQQYHAAHPYVFRCGGAEYVVHYEAAESRSGVFGGNSNWRGPIWVQMNYLLIESLQKFQYYYGDDFTVECPAGSGRYLTLEQIADELSERLIRLFTRDDAGRRAVFGGQATFQRDPHWRDHVLFYEYFHGDNGAGLGASHQTGWTGLIAKLIHQQAQRLTEQAAA